MSLRSRSVLSAVALAIVLLGSVPAGASVEAAALPAGHAVPERVAWSDSSIGRMSGAASADTAPARRLGLATLFLRSKTAGGEAPALVGAAMPSSPEAAPAGAALTPVELVELTPLTVDVWNADERYFAVTGETPELIVASAQADIPPDRSGAERYAMAYAGPTVWDHVPTYAIDPSTGRCTMTGVSSTTRYEATLPQWTAPSEVPPEMITWWAAVLEHLRVHEGEHIAIFEEYVSLLPSRVAGQPCSSWEGIVNAWSAELVSAQTAFDAAESGWALPVYAGPLDW